ncbi:hypothetical protein GCM10010840_25370 [Deinococcus aerolatus]|uniref:Transposase IS4-like domain-containing protein n=1 Tax=Deinococcus aerolatus TaxID=522487 RepID=A0ABQ2GD42_9DEIO|nr:hypothetical protein GCM10010840_25370 [Deinococcus aerolatus]
MVRYRPHHSLGRRAAIHSFYRWTRRHFSTRKTCKHQNITDAGLIALLLGRFVFKVPHASIWWSLLREDRHGLPSYAQAYIRSVRLLAQLETLVSTAEHLAEVIIDSMSIPVCRPKRTKHCTFPGVRWGYGTQGNFYGYKLHAWVTGGGKIVQYALRPANLHDLTVGFELNGRWPEFGGPKIIGDKGYAALGFVFPPKNTRYDTGWRAGGLTDFMRAEGKRAASQLQEWFEEGHGSVSADPVAQDQVRPEVSSERRFPAHDSARSEPTEDRS